jgi:peptidoglycan hydrolase-like protein with peptidoglycan-binding domain
MSALRSLALTALLALVGCAHAKKTEKQPANTTNGTERPSEDIGVRIPEAPGRPPLAATPEAMFVEGGVAKIQHALEQNGLLKDHETGKLDEETTAAVRKFQERSGIAATGVPDHETIVKLGLDPNQLFRHAESQTPEQAREKKRQSEGGGE